MSVRVDFTDAGGFDPVPTGAYEVQVIDVEEKTSKAGNQMLVWTLQVTEGEHTGSKLNLYTALTKKAAFKLREFLQAVGEEIELTELDIEPSEYLGRNLIIEVVQETYTNEETGETSNTNSIKRCREAA